MDPRVTGEQRYSVEVERPGMLHAAFVRSPHPHARVRSVSAPDDLVVLTGDDVADLGRYGCQVKDQRVLADVARHVGDVVAAVAAPTRAAARVAAQQADVVYEELPAVFDPLDAVAPGAPLLHREAEAMRRAYIERNANLGDPAFVTNPVARLISKAHGARLRNSGIPNS